MSLPAEGLLFFSEAYTASRMQLRGFITGVTARCPNSYSHYIPYDMDRERRILIVSFLGRIIKMDGKAGWKTVSQDQII